MGDFARASLRVRPPCCAAATPNDARATIERRRVRAWLAASVARSVGNIPRGRGVRSPPRDGRRGATDPRSGSPLSWLRAHSAQGVLLRAVHYTELPLPPGERERGDRLRLIQRAAELGNWRLAE